MEINLTIQAPCGRHKFSAVVHRLGSPDQFFLDPLLFYKKWGKQIPEGRHHEIEIKQPNPEELRQHKLHVHISERSGQPFVCYPLAIPTPERAQELFQVWCVGTVGMIDCGIDLNIVYKECGDDAKKYLKLMDEKYRVWVAVETVVGRLA